jgi:hypothetical protein
MSSQNMQMQKPPSGGVFYDNRQDSVFTQRAHMFVGIMFVLMASYGMSTHWGTWLSPLTNFLGNANYILGIAFGVFIAFQPQFQCVNGRCVRFSDAFGSGYTSHCPMKC